MIHDDPSMNYSDRDVFTNDFVKHNLPFYNFIHHLLFAGWADNDCYTSPGSGSPFRGQLLGEGKAMTGMGGTEIFLGKCMNASCVFTNLMRRRVSRHRVCWLGNGRGLSTHSLKFSTFLKPSSNHCKLY